LLDAWNFGLTKRKRLVLQYYVKELIQFGEFGVSSDAEFHMDSARLLGELAAPL